MKNGDLGGKVANGWQFYVSFILQYNIFYLCLNYENKIYYYYIKYDIYRNDN